MTFAVTHAAWSFSNDGGSYNAEVGKAIIDGYASGGELLAEERHAMPVLARGASLRFLLTRLYDWINTPADAMVTRKDPLAFLKRLDYYSSVDGQGLFL